MSINFFGKHLDLAPSDDQNLLRESVARFLAGQYSFAQRRAALANGGWRPEVWRAFADLGLLGATLSSTFDGLDGGPEESMVICEELGKALVLEPYLDSSILGVSLLSDGGETSDSLLRGVRAGSVLLAPALYESGTRFTVRPAGTAARRSGEHWILKGAKAGVAGARFATHLVVSARTPGAADETGMSLFVVASDSVGVRRRDYRLIDGRTAADVEFDTLTLSADALIGEQGRALPRIEYSLDVATAALCAEALGVMRIILASTVEFARQRHQFGHPIASFQSLQHRMADMHTRVERAHSMVLMATLAIGLPDSDRRKSISAAKAFISKALRFTAESAIQIHGGVGTTDEIAISHYFKRATVIESQFGNADFHFRRIVREDG